MKATDSALFLLKLAREQVRRKKDFASIEALRHIDSARVVLSPRSPTPAPKQESKKTYTVRCPRCYWTKTQATPFKVNCADCFSENIKIELKSEDYV